MNIYTKLNEIIEYIENNLEEKIDYIKLSQILGTNEYTMKSVFSLITNMTLTEYIRCRRLSNAGFELYKNNEKIIDIAVKYGYENATAFSRAFEKFHGIKPSQVKVNPEKLKLFSKLMFNETVEENLDIEYSIIELDEKIVYGKAMNTTEQTIGREVPVFFQKMRKEFVPRFGEFDYGVILYEERFESNNLKYFVAYEKQVEGFDKIIIPKSKWIRFKINSQEAKDIQRVTNFFYSKFVSSLKFNIKPNLELEWYHDDITEFLVPIED